METILVHLDVPVLKEYYDLFVPLDLEIQQLVRIIVSGLSDLNGGAYCESGYELLASREPDMLFNPENTLRDYSIHDGASLILL